MAVKLPAIQWYPGDWLRDPGVQSLSYEDQGIWFAILMRMWEGEERGKLTLNGHAMPVEALARLLGLDNQKVNQTLTTLLTYGVTSVEPSTGIIYSRRMVRDENLRKTRAECGKLGGNPVLLNQPANQKPTTKVKQIPTPSSSSSSSSSKEPPTPSTPIEKWTELLCETHPGVCDPRFPATFCEDNWHRLREDAERFNVFMGQVFDGLRAHCEYWAVDGNRFAISLDKWLLGGGWKKAPPKRAESATAPGNYDHLPLGFTQAEKDKMARVARERAEDGLQ